MSTPNMELELWPSGALQPEVPVNASLQKLDALVRPGGIVQDVGTTTPPSVVSGDIGKSWVVGTGATGDWAGHDDDIALLVGIDLWAFITPNEMWRVGNLDDGNDYVFDGSSGWSIVSESAGSVTIPIGIACSDELTALTAGTAKATFRMPFAFSLTGVRASLSTAQASGSTFTVDINENGVSVLSTKITIDNTEKTSVTAATPAVISDSSLADDSEITIDIDQIGNGTAKGLKVWLIGNKT